MSMDRSQPDVPSDIKTISPNLSYQRCTELWTEVLEEVCNEEYWGRTHNVGTYDKGCRGPICRKALREHPRHRAHRGGLLTKIREERLYDPVLEYFYTILKYRIRAEQHKLYKELA